MTCLRRSERTLLNFHADMSNSSQNHIECPKFDYIRYLSLYGESPILSNAHLGTRVFLEQFYTGEERRKLSFPLFLATSSSSILDEYLALTYRAYLIDVTVTVTVTVTITDSNKNVMDIKLPVLTIISKNQQSPSREEVWIHKDS
ncbi:hypothetical protein BOTNAR_0468g00010 [Botryotinia narcissicola]|uniref:Uncharacterized protein n=1 Tax=Botryotinia narcissicola TaxID=278944 RepID=A0A4Z1HUX9_9HELO|nr:hypothetical protein BOTNAR_0468g00010 [Botryotinia narcissicola]